MLKKLDIFDQIWQIHIVPSLHVTSYLHLSVTMAGFVLLGFQDTGSISWSVEGRIGQYCWPAYWPLELGQSMLVLWNNRTCKLHHFSLHLVHALHRCGLLLHMLHIAWSVCPSVRPSVCVLSTRWTVLNQARCHLGGWLTWVRIRVTVQRGCACLPACLPAHKVAKSLVTCGLQHCWMPPTLWLDT